MRNDWLGDRAPVKPFRISHFAFRILILGFLLGCGSPRPDGDEVQVTIPRGTTFDSAVDSLVSGGIIRSPGLFRWYARLRGLPRALKSGIYAFRPGEDWGTVVGTMKAGRGVEVRFTLPEGWTLLEAADLAERELGIPRDSLLKAARNPERLAHLGVEARPGASVEGYLFPTTYVLAKGLRAQDLVRVMTQEFLNRWPAEWDARLDSLRWTRHEAVILASIVEAETRYQPDAPFVSAVYHNRLRRRMPLQADPTVAYAHGGRLKRVYEKHLRVHSPYNTYLHPGLPPGPISQPGTASLRAALYPADVPFLYFVARPDGKHVFSMSYREHLRAIREARSGTSAVR
jgi:UPF0755 protein